MLSDVLDSLQDARAAKEGSFSSAMISQENLAHIKALNALAEERGQTLAQMAIAWVLRDPRVTSALIGARTVAQLEDSLGALQRLNFAPEELQQIDQHATEGGIDIWKASSSVKEL